MSESKNKDYKRIAKNTGFLYFRMLFIMAVSLFTSRVVLDKLGVDDFGIYGAVGGIVGMLAFLNGTLSTSTSRFLTFELGTNDCKRLQETFCTSFYTHLFLALIVALLLETGGLWFLYNKLIIPEERLFAAQCVLHLSVFTIIISITQVPYGAVVVAHENMKIYAYLGIFDAMAKLGIAYLLSITSWDRLIFYAILIALSQFFVAMAYRIYSIRHYFESHLLLCFNKDVFKKMLNFSGWTLVANISQVLSQQGHVIIINMFFPPAMVAAQTVGNQIAAAITQFSNNVMTAVRPQIIKLYAAKEYVESRKLTLQSAVYMFELMLLLGLPCIIVMDFLLHLWLVEVPEYAVVFSQFIVLRCILDCNNVTFYIPMVASGELKDNSLIGIVISVILFGLLYFLLYIGLDVMWVQYLAIIKVVFWSYLFKPLICVRKIGYNWKEILSCFFMTFKVAIVPVGISLVLYHYVTISSLWTMMCVVMLSALSVLISSYTFLDKETKGKVKLFISNKIHKLCKL